MSKKIQVNSNQISVIPNGIVEAKMKVSKHQMDILAIILAEIGKPTDKDDNLVYTITAADFGVLNNIDVHDAAKYLRNYICEGDKINTSMRLIGFDLCRENGDFEHYNWFSSVIYTSGIAKFTLTPEIKKYLVAFKKDDHYRVYARLRYILPMKSVYSKRIYLMCREYISSGKRFCDTDWNLFKEKLGIPMSYKTTVIQKQILDKAVEEINEVSDIHIEYVIDVNKTKGGSTPTGIKFYIDKKYETNEDILEEEKEKHITSTLEELSPEELQKLSENIEAVKALLANK